MTRSKLVYLFFVIFWAGLVTGVSLFAAPIKFLVPGLSRELELKLGSLTFGYFNYIEWSVCILILLTLFWLIAKKQLQSPKLMTILSVFLALILVMDSFYLLPELHSYVRDLASGEASIATAADIAPYHRLYVIGDFTKLFLQLALFGIVVIKENIEA